MQSAAVREVLPQRGRGGRAPRLLRALLGSNPRAGLDFAAWPPSRRPPPSPTSAWPPRRPPRGLAATSSAVKDAALLAMAAALEARTPEILEANARDLEAGREGGLSSALMDRLALDERRGGRDGRRRARDRRAARPGRRGDRRLPAAQRARRAQGARAARRRRRRLRGAAERHDRRRRAGAEVGQRRGAARLLVGGALQRGARAGRGRGRRGGRAARRLAVARGRRRARGAGRAGRPGGRGRPDHPARRRGPEEGAERRREGARDLRRLGQLPRVRRRDRRPRARARRSSLNAKTQRPGVCNAAETLLVHGAVAPEFLPRVLRRCGGRRRAPRRRGGRGRSTAVGHAGDRGGLGGGVPRARARGQGRRLRRGGDRARQPLRLGPLGGDRHRAAPQRAGVPARRRRGLRVRQRLDALHRRRRVRDGRRDRQLDPEAARPRADRRARAVHVQVPGRGRRPDPP